MPDPYRLHEPGRMVILSLNTLSNLHQEFGSEHSNMGDFLIWLERVFDDYEAPLINEMNELLKTTHKAPLKVEPALNTGLPGKEIIQPIAGSPLP